jgi:hypothetical protein
MTTFSVDSKELNLIYCEDPSVYTIHDISSKKLDRKIESFDKIIEEGKYKILLSCDAAFIVFVNNLLTNLAYLQAQYPVHLFIIYLKNFSNQLVEQSTHLKFLKDYLEKYKISHKIIYFEENPEIALDKCLYLDGLDTPYASVKCVSDFNYYIADFIKNKNVKPYRKVYLSRGKAALNLNRYLNEDKLEEYFKSIGFEVVYNEDFENLEDQINFFYEIKVLAGISGTGLINSLFMQNKSTVIEISTPITFFGTGNQQIKYHLHTYASLSLLKEHLHISIPSYNGKFEEIDELLNKKIKETINTL